MGNKFELIFDRLNMSDAARSRCLQVHHLNVFHFYVNVCAIAPVAVVGVLLNVVNIVILGRQKLAPAAVFMLKTLAVLDIGVLVSAFVYFVARYSYGNRGVSAHGFRYAGWGFNLYLAKSVDPIYNSLLQPRNWCLVLISLDRLLITLAPLKAHVWSTRRRAVQSLVGIVGAVLLLQSLNYTFVQKYSFFVTFNACTGERQVRTKRTSSLSNALFYIIDHVFYIVCNVTLPLVLLIVINFALIVCLIKSARFRRTMMNSGTDSTASGHRQITKMVVGIVVVFVICEATPSIDRIVKLCLQFGYPRSIQMKLAYLRRVGLFLVVLDSSLNFFIYFTTNSKFHAEVLQLFSRAMIRNRLGLVVQS
ncbi:FMRFamide peptide receptor frpr-18-like [Tubulanus polymorphus]|uniref:FMRFamide peptide receptor frpr-18-like n=1 Tax=Tubulanus polymorphus TaxID=672921 RepID=UPI003DA39626